VIEMLKHHEQALADLCERYQVDRLEVFGSAAGAARDFDPAASDVDLIVQFAPGTDMGPWLSHYFSFQESLERLLGRPVDLVMADALHEARSKFTASVEQSREVVYAA